MADASDKSDRLDKKRAKAQTKAIKKLAKRQAVPATTESAAGDIHRAAVSVGGASSPAERSAAAAEKQVALQRYRVLFAVLMFLIAVATLIVTIRPWDRDGRSPNSHPTNQERDTRQQ
jgi:hypothetical protein